MAPRQPLVRPELTPPMDRHSTLNPQTAQAEETSPGIAAADAFLSLASEPAQFPGEDGGQSLVQMAQSDLDAALQLLADRAHYITGASGAAIALRRGEYSDMICRASAGSNAPELGTLLSMEYGISGESARTRKPLLCEDTETDPRVNREGCRHLGIASVVVMPILFEGQVLGVFELFSGKPRAFGTRDLSALQRLSEMVVTAVLHAIAAQGPRPPETFPTESEKPITHDPVQEQLHTLGNQFIAKQPEAQTGAVAKTPAFSPPDSITPAPEKTVEPAAPPRPFFWSAAMQPATVGSGKTEPEPLLSVPPILRNLQKCQACGFPISQGRTFCVECEEKLWRGQPLSRPSHPEPPVRAFATAEDRDDEDKEPPLAQVSVPSALVAASQACTATETQTPASVATIDATSEPNDLSTRSDSLPFLNSTQPAESWLAANKYIFIALLVLAIIGTILWMR
jgi:hypothetical protein